MLFVRLCQGFRPKSTVFDVPFVPGVPDHHIGPIMCPGYCKQIEAAIFEQFHAVVFYGDLGVGGARPLPQVALRVAIPHDHYVQGLSGPKVADGHSVQGNASRFRARHRPFTRFH